VLLAARGNTLSIGTAIGQKSRWIMALALFCYAIAFSLAYLLLNAGTGSLILFASVQISMLAWALIKGDRPSPIALLGMAIALGACVYL
jgi:drug/metabolite transporter (DMT)-like permease